MEGHRGRGQAGDQISVGGHYEGTPAALFERIKIEATRAVAWLVNRMQGCASVELEQVLLQCPRACEGMQRDAHIASILIGMLNQGAKAANLVLSQSRGRQGLAYRRWVSLGEAGRLEGHDHSTTEGGDPPEDPRLDHVLPIDDGAGLWGIYMITSQVRPGAKMGELPRPLCKPTIADGEGDALYSIVGSLEQMAPEYTLWKLCASGSDANTFACLVRLALRCG